MKYPFLAAAFCAVMTPAFAQTTLTVLHGPTADPTYIDLGPAGDSVGDQRFFEFGGTTTENETVLLDFLLTTTAMPADGSDLERRMTLAVFSFANGPDDQLIVQGIGQYPRAGSTVTLNATLQRAIVGGTGRFAGATGTMASTHLADGSWQHVMTID